jgi:hypothetical protein
MERAERAALYIFLFGVGLNMIAVAGPLAFPAAPIIAWRCVLYAGVTITFLSGVFLVYEYRHLARSARSFLLIGMIVCGFGFAVFSVWYFWLPSGPQKEAPLLQTPEASLAHYTRFGVEKLSFAPVRRSLPPSATTPSRRL